MANKNVIDDEITKAQMEFNKEVFKLGLFLIEGCKAGRFREESGILDAIIKIFEAQPKASQRD